MLQKIKENIYGLPFKNFYYTSKVVKNKRPGVLINPSGILFLITTFSYCATAAFTCRKTLTNLQNGPCETCVRQQKVHRNRKRINVAFAKPMQ